MVAEPQDHDGVAPDRPAPIRTLRRWWAAALAVAPVLVAGAVAAGFEVDLFRDAGRVTAAYLTIDWRAGVIRRAGLGILSRPFVGPAEVSDSLGMAVWIGMLIIGLIAVMAVIWGFARTDRTGAAVAVALWGVSPLGVPLLV